MLKMKNASLLRSVVAAFCLSLVMAQGARAQAADPERVAAAKELLVASNVEKQMAAIVPTMFNQFRTIMRVSPQDTKVRDQIFDEVQKMFIERTNEVVDQIAILYARKFTVEEMHAVTDFYRTPAGQKFVLATPELAVDAMKIGQAWGQKIGVEAAQKIQQEMQSHGVKL
jgi:uncharacterized protein